MHDNPRDGEHSRHAEHSRHDGSGDGRLDEDFEYFERIWKGHRPRQQQKMEGKRIPGIFLGFKNFVGSKVVPSPDAYPTAIVAPLTEFANINYLTGKRDTALMSHDSGKVYIDHTKEWDVEPLDPSDYYTTGGYAFPLRELHFIATKTMGGIEKDLRCRDLNGPIDLLDVMETRPNMIEAEEIESEVEDEQPGIEEDTSDADMLIPDIQSYAEGTYGEKLINRPENAIGRRNKGKVRIVGSHFTKENCEGNVRLPKPDF